MILSTGASVVVTFYEARSVVGCIVRVDSHCEMSEVFDWAKCNPLDKFNVEVGKAKALGRALQRTSLTRDERKEVTAATLWEPPLAIVRELTAGRSIERGD